MSKEVAADVLKVNKALEAGINSTGEASADALRAMRPAIDAWAKRGTDAANTRTSVPGLNGWPGWVHAGSIFLDGIEEIAKSGKHEKLDAITATIKEIPATEIKAVHAAAHAVKARVVAAADAAIARVGADASAGAFYTLKTILISHLSLVAVSLLGIVYLVKRK